MEKLILPLVGGGIALYAVTRGGSDDTAATPSSAARIPIAPPSDRGAPIAVVKTQKLVVKDSINTGIMQKPGTGLLDPIGLGQYVTQMESTITSELKAKYDQLTSTAKKAGADALNNSLNLNPPLKGNESYKEVSGRVGAVAGAAAGVAACSATGIGAAAAPLCGIAGAYLGKKIAPVVAEYAKKAVKVAVLKPVKAVGKALKKLKFW